MKKSKKIYFQTNASDGSASSKYFWNTVKPFKISKGTLWHDKIITEAPIDTTLTIKGGNLVSIKAKDEVVDEKILVQMFNNHYINILKNHQDLLRNL